MLTRLYRYRSCETEYFEDELVHAVDRGEFYFSAIDRANDPFDCNPKYERSTPRELLDLHRSLKKKFMVDLDSSAGNQLYPDPRAKKRVIKKDLRVNYRNIIKWRTLWDKLPDRLRATTEIICLSESWNNPLMWSHYASGHNGIVLVVDLQVDLAMTADDDLPLKCDYVEDRPIVTTCDLVSWINADKEPTTPNHSSTRAFKAYALTKSNVWSYESEWRIQKRSTGRRGYRHVPAIRPVEVVVGARVSARRKQDILKICAGKVSVSEARMSADNYSLSRKSIIEA